MSSVVVLQHNSCETLGIVEQALTACGLNAECVHAYERAGGAQAHEGVRRPGVFQAWEALALQLV